MRPPPTGSAGPAPRTSRRRRSPRRALEIATDYLEWNALGSDRWVSAPRVNAKKAFATPAPRLVYRVGVVLRQPLTPISIDVDAASGAVARAFVDKETFLGEGDFEFNGQPNLFKTGAGKGVIYKTIANAAIDKPTTSALKEVALATAVPGTADNGDFFGRFCWILDAPHQTGGIPDQFFNFVSPIGHNFLGDPHGITAAQDIFDGANAYNHLTNYALAMTKLGGGPLPNDFSMPTCVNVPGW